MRNTGNKTPTTKTEQTQTTSEKSAKKLVQARLPFKIIGSGVLVPSSSDVANAEVGNTEAVEAVQSETVRKLDARKRKLSYVEEEDKTSGEQPSADSKENLSIVTSKKKKTSTSEDVIVLDESEKEDECEAVKVNEKDVKRKSLVATTASPKTPLQGSKKRKGAGTPKSATSGSAGGRRKQSPRGSATKLQIKLPLGGKKKRRRSQRKSITGEAGSTSEDSSESSDDIEIIAEELNPLKRPKVETGKELERKDQKQEEKTQDANELTNTIEEKSAKSTRTKSAEKCLTSGDDKLNESKNKNDGKDEKDISQSNSELDDDKKVLNIEIGNRKNSKKDSKTTESADVKGKISKISAENKDSPRSKPKNEEDIETSVKRTPKPDTVSISDNEETITKKTPSKISKTTKGRKSLQTLDTFMSKEISAKQQENTNTKQNEIKSPKLSKSKQISEKVKPTKSTKNQHVSTADDDDDADDDEDAVDSSGSSIVEISGDKSKEYSTDNNTKATESASTANVAKLNSSITATVANSKSGLTPKQQRLMEQRRLAREEKERRIQEQKEEKERKAQEEKLQKQREKEEKDLAKKREREEKEEQKRKEREEKEEVKRKEREEKERKRLAEIDAKNEERRKRNEVKEEEQRKKDEERKRKEQEKEEAEQKKKKAAEAFTKFFVPKSNRLSKAAETVEQDSVKEGVEGAYDGENSRSESLAFRPFQIKGDMKLAPLCRKVFNDASRERLDFFINAEKNKDNSKSESQSLYLDELKTGKIIPGKWRRPTTDTKSDDDDVVIIEDELEQAAQTIVEESARPVERYRVKLYKFHENRRPPYFGTWRKKTNVITARKPLAQDKKYFDYEVDSDLEWEEEEPGESLDGSDEEKEKESEDEDYEVDNEWFVPHGHLSDEELQNEDEGGLGDDNTREAQKAKLKILQQEFAQEMKKKTEKIKPRLIGCIWQDINGNQPELCPNIIWNSLNLRAMLYTTPPLVEEPLVDTVSEANEPSSPTNSTTTAGTTDKLKRILLTEAMLKDLIRLVHGNRHSKVFLIKEFIAYIEQTENAIKNGDVRGPLKSVIRDKIDEFALWQVVEANNNLKSKKKNKKKLCWLVSEEKLKKYNLESLELHNKWTYTLPPKFVESTSNIINESLLNEDEELEAAKLNESKSNSSKSKSHKISKKEADVITKFTKVLTTEEKTKQIQRNVVASKIDTTSKIPTTPTEGNATPKAKSVSSSSTATNKQQTTTPTGKKRVPLLMSVARGQQIPTPAKNALISQFLKKNKDTAENKTAPSAATPTNMDVDEIVILD